MTGTPRSNAKKNILPAKACFILLAAALVTAFADSFYVPEADPSIIWLRWIVYFMLLLFITSILKFLQKSPGFLSGIPSGLRESFTDSRKNKLRLAACFFLIYAIWAIVHYPGTCGTDTLNQIKDLITGTEPIPFGWIDGQEPISVLMNDHHPVFDTLIFTTFYKIGDLAGKPNLGMFLYVLIQISLLSYLFADIVCSLDRYGAPFAIQLLSAAFFCMPFMAYFSITMIKDTLFSMVFILYFGKYLELFFALKQQIKPKASDWIRLICFSILIALTNKKGIYIAAVSNLLLIPGTKNKKCLKQVMLSFLLPILIVSVFIRHLLFPLFNIYPGGRQEMLGITFQQVVGTWLEFPDDFTPKDIEALNAVLTITPEQYQPVYEPYSSDMIKGKYNFYATSEDIFNYLKVWLKIGIRHPLAYLKIMAKVNGGAFSPSKTINIYSGIPYIKGVRLSQHEKLTGARNFFRNFYDWVKNVPGITLLFRDAFYLFWIPVILISILIASKGSLRITAFAPILINILFLMVGPVSWTRYGLCQLYTLPLQFSILYRNHRGIK